MNARKLVSMGLFLATVLVVGELQARPGTWVRVGKAGAWRGTIAGTAHNGKISTVERNGRLSVTNPRTGIWRAVGKPEFRNTRFMFAVGGSLYTIERSGSLYRVNPRNGRWSRVGKAGMTGNPAWARKSTKRHSPAISAGGRLSAR